MDDEQDRVECIYPRGDLRDDNRHALDDDARTNDCRISIQPERGFTARSALLRDWLVHSRGSNSQERDPWISHRPIQKSSPA